MPATVLPAAGEWLQLAVHSADGRVLYGDIALHALPDQPGTYELGVTLGSGYQGRGLAAEALHRVLHFLFEDQQAHRVVAFCDARNAAVAALLRRTGFRQESHQVEADHFKDEWTTLDGYAILGPEWPQGEARSATSARPTGAGQLRPRCIECGSIAPTDDDTNDTSESLGGCKDAAN